jgi:F420-0:gamma-glutamyl ligase
LRNQDPENGAAMRGKALMIVGILLTIAGIVCFVHPQWQGRDKIMEVDVAGKQLQVTTRRVTDIPPLFAGAVLVMGICTAGLGFISRPAAKKS